MSGEDKNGTKPMKVPGKEAATAPLPKRFYANVTVEPATPEPGFAIMLDGRTVRTPKKMPLVIPSNYFPLRH